MKLCKTVCNPPALPV